MTGRSRPADAQTDKEFSQMGSRDHGRAGKVDGDEGGVVMARGRRGWWCAITSSLVSDGSDEACHRYLWAERPRQGKDRETKQDRK